MKSGTPKKAPIVSHKKTPNGNYMREFDDKKTIPILRKRQLSK